MSTDPVSVSQSGASPEPVDLWIVTTRTEVDSEGQFAMIVDAATEQEAAMLGADWFTEHPDYAEALPITHVFVAPWGGRTAYAISCAANPAELQCCGGGGMNGLARLAGHWATCPNAPKGNADD